MLLMGCSLKLGGWFLGSPIHYFCTAVDRGKLGPSETLANGGPPQFKYWKYGL